MLSQTMSEKLGEEQFKSRIKRGNQILYSVGGVACVLISILIMLFYLAVGEPDQQSDSVIILLSTVCFFMILGLVSLYQFLDRYGRQIVIYEHGLVLFVNEKPLQAVFWDNVEGATYHSIIQVERFLWSETKSPTPYLKLFQPNKRVFHFSMEYQHAEKMMDMILEQLKKVSVPKAVQALHDQQSLTIGKITLSTEGFQSGKRATKWQEVAQFERVTPQQLTFYTQNGQRVTLISNTHKDPQAYLLFELVNVFVPEEVGYKQPPAWVNAAKVSF